MRLVRDFTGAIVLDPSYQFEVWRAHRAEELQDAATLAEAVYDCEGLARELVAALTQRHRCHSSIDQTVLQHTAARAVIERHIDQVLAAEEARGVWRQCNPYPEAA